MPEVEIGSISDFFSRPVVAGIKLAGDLKVGDTLHIKGHTTDLEFVVQSMQVNNADVKEAHQDAAVGIKVPDRVRRGDRVFKKTPD